MQSFLKEAAELIASAWPFILSVSVFAMSVIATVHAVMSKREPRAAVTWVGIVWLVPLVGVAMYALFGINRIRRRAQALRSGAQTTLADEHGCTPSDVELHTGSPEMASLSRLVDSTTPQRLLAGNRIELLRNGDAAFPAMLEAIDGATTSVTLTTYIFDNDTAGKLFVAALERAVARRVEVRVLIDDVGARYSFPPVVGALKKAGVPVARFLPSATPFRFPYINLRNHRKALVVDGKLGFTGGMNIRAGNLIETDPAHPIYDLQARVQGPVVAHLQAAFAEDWQFTRRETLEGPTWFGDADEVGPVLCRGILEGPDRPEDAIVMTLLGALSTAKERVCIATPYFVPPENLIAAIAVAVMRGVSVDIILPERNNLVLVGWASMAAIAPLLERECRVWLSPRPFDHTKLVVVDGAWTLLGSANWDIRSLRLNFELNIECYDRALAASAEELFQTQLARSRRFTVADWQALGFGRRFRNAVAHLFMPYL